MPQLVSIEIVDKVPMTGHAALDAYLATVDPKNYRILHFDDGTLLHTSSPRDLEAAHADFVRSLMAFGRGGGSQWIPAQGKDALPPA